MTSLFVNFQTIRDAALEGKTENDKLDYKVSWYPWNKDRGIDKNELSKLKNELVKDLISLANGSSTSAGEPGFLWVGFDDRTREICDANIPKEGKDGEEEKAVGKLKDEITQILSKYIDSPMTFDIDYFEYEEKTTILIKIEPHQHLFYLAEDLETPKKTFNKGSLIYRNNACIDTATLVTQEELKKSIESWLKVQQDKEKKTSGSRSKKIEIKIKAREILSLMVSPIDMKSLSEDQGLRSSVYPRVYYEYYSLNRERLNVTEGYLFLGKYTTTGETFSGFYEKFEDELPDSLSIFLLKETRNKKVVDKKADIYRKIERLGLSKRVGKQVNYFDEVIWDGTFDHREVGDHIKRQDFVDQKIYNVIGWKNEKPELSETSDNRKSIDFFLELDDDLFKPISIVYGSGGVGKTTFCETLAYQIENSSEIRKKVFYVEGERLTRYFLSERIQISSLEDLYKLCCDDQSDFSNLSEEHFRLNFIAGNIIVIVDAIEELESALGERLNLQGFFESLQSLHERFQSTRIIVTTREHFLPQIRDVEQSVALDISYYQLQGFDKFDLDEFLKKKYKSQSPNTTPKKIKQVHRFIEDNSLFHEGYVAPLFVNWVCEIIDRPSRSMISESRYWFKDITIDNLLVNLLNREIEKQSLNMNIDDMFLLLEEIVIVNSGKLKLGDFDEYIEATTNQKSENYLKNPLFEVSQKEVCLKYDILSNLIKSRFLYHALSGGKASPNSISILKECYLGEGDIFTDLVDLFTRKNQSIKENIHVFITYCKSQLSNEFVREIDKEKIKKSISALLHLLMEVEKASDKETRTNLVRYIYGSTISSLYIYGDLGSLDFRNMSIRDSHFDSYDSFFKSDFPEEDVLIFFATRFSHIKSSNSRRIRPSYFDSSCQYNDCNLNEIFNENSSKEDKKMKDMTKDIGSLFGYIDTNQKSVNKIKQRCSITYSKGVEKLLKLLCDNEFLEVIDKQGQKMYKVKKEFHDDIPNIKLGILPEKLEDFIKDEVR